MAARMRPLPDFRIRRLLPRVEGPYPRDRDLCLCAQLGRWRSLDPDERGATVRALVIYESEFGATRAVAEAICRGLSETGQLGELDAEVVDSRGLVLSDGWSDDVALVVIGAPTHARSLPTPASRQSALDWPHKPGSTLRLEPRADAAGVREWLANTDLRGVAITVFATRMDMSRLLAGSAAPRLARMVVKAGGRVVSAPQEFLVAKDGQLLAPELDRAYDWGRVLAGSLPNLAAARGESR